MAIKAVIFDCFGVLIPSHRVQLHKKYPNLSDELTTVEHQSDLGFITRQTFTDSVSKLVNIPTKDVMPRYYNSTKYNNSSIRLAYHLKSSGKYKIGLLSNIGHGWLDDFLSEMKKMDLFDTVVLSSDVGILKPDPRIFELVAQKLGVSTSDCVMIDDVKDNIDGAISSGMKGIVFTSVDQTKHDLELLLRKNNA